MSQPLQKWASADEPYEQATTAAPVVVLSERHVLMRLPDCSAHSRRALVDIGRSLLQPITWIGFGRQAFEELIRPWRHPRTFFAGIVGVGLIVSAVVMMTGPRWRSAPHADAERHREKHDDASAAEAEGTYVASRVRANTSAALQDKSLEDAPAYDPKSEANRPRANQPASVEGPAITPPQSTNRGAATGPAVQQGHLELRVTRVPAQYP